jgi:hypothetical protein
MEVAWETGKSMAQLKMETEEVLKCFQNPVETSRCRFAVNDQYGNIVCMRNFECPGFCDGLEKCPYVLKKGECYGV